MKLKQTTFYALKILYRFHLESNRIVTSNTIANKENLSHGVVLRVLQKLRKEGFLYVYQGRGAVSGGFSLAKSIDDITLLDIVEGMEKIDIYKYLASDDMKRGNTLSNKILQLNDDVKNEFSKYTIRELFESKKVV